MKTLGAKGPYYPVPETCTHCGPIFFFFFIYLLLFLFWCRTNILMFSDQSHVQLTFHSFCHFTDKEYWFYIYYTARQELVSFTAVCFLRRLEQSHLIKGTGAERLAV